MNPGVKSKGIYCWYLLCLHDGNYILADCSNFRARSFAISHIACKEPFVSTVPWSDGQPSHLYDLLHFAIGVTPVDPLTHLLHDGIPVAAVDESTMPRRYVRPTQVIG